MSTPGETVQAGIKDSFNQVIKWVRHLWWNNESSTEVTAIQAQSMCIEKERHVSRGNINASPKGEHKMFVMACHTPAGWKTIVKAGEKEVASMVQ